MPDQQFDEIFDVTVPFSDDLPVWPGDPAIQARPLARIRDGSSCNVTQLVMPSHCGTHVDPPWHFIDDGAHLDELPLERWIGPCQVVQIPLDVRRIGPADLDQAGVSSNTSRLLLKTANADKWHPGKLAFDSDYVALTPEAARWVVERMIELVGIDYLSIELFDDEANETHRTLLGNNVLVIEGMDLRRVEPGDYTLICLPLKLRGGDGAPARVILTRPRQTA